jgi:hypothetical protein
MQKEWAMAASPFHEDITTNVGAIADLFMARTSAKMTDSYLG